MPDAGKVRALIAARFPRSMDAWRERLDAALPVPEIVAPTLARVERADGITIELAGDAPGTVEGALKIRLLRHLGGAEYVVHLLDRDDQNRLALHGHLDATRGGCRHRALNRERMAQ